MATQPTDSAPEAQPGSGDAPTAFEDAFEAFASGKEPAPDQPGAAQPDPNLEAKPDAEPASSEAGQSDAAAAPAPPAQPASDDFDLASLPPAAQKAFERLQHSERSARGRIAALARQSQQQPRQAPPEAGQPSPDDKAPANPFDTDEMKALEADYPEIAGPLLKIVREQHEKLHRLEGTARTVDEDRETAFLVNEVTRLEELMPDWATWGGDSRFDTWITTQPRHVQEAAQRNNQVIVDAAEAHDVLQRFKAAHSTPGQAPTPDPKRERQLAAGRDAVTKTPATASGVPDDYEAAFKHFAAEGQKR